eukprot:m.139953 g.139953  ORF g.139953 m.139953 type:complete len:60 (+) comp14029_c1_seq2:935-1114(+)
MLQHNIGIIFSLAFLGTFFTTFILGGGAYGLALATGINMPLTEGILPCVYLARLCHMVV